MNAKWIGVALAAVVAAGCGKGRAIFDIDVYSFLKAADSDTLPYLGPLPPGVPDTIPVQTINSIGLTSSIVDTVLLTGTVSFVNQTDTGTVVFQVYFDSVANNVYATPPAFGVTADVFPASTTDSSFSVNLPDALKPLFLASQVYVGLRASATPGGASSPLGPVKGTAKLTALRARIVIQDKIF
ncbi:MAG TPA: hypothetical protein VEK86_11150 [Gemmatimonadales bacterium]|nr:hypothetical protein [Gemmatimonadales bacterium]